MKPSRAYGAAAACALLLQAAVASANRSGAPGGRTLAPGESHCAATSCHDSFALGDPAGGVLLRLHAGAAAFTSYTPGLVEDVSLHVTSSASGRRSWGFQATVLAMDGAAHGASLAPADARSQGFDIGGRRYVTHSAAGTSGSAGEARWDLRLTAPPAGTGPLIVYACANAANGSFSVAGDHVACAAFRVEERPETLGLRRDASIRALAGGGDDGCGPRTQPPAARAFATTCGATPSCESQGWSLLVASTTPLGAELAEWVLPDEALPASGEPLVFYEIEACGLTIGASRRGRDVVLSRR